MRCSEAISYVSAGWDGGAAYNTNFCSRGDIVSDRVSSLFSEKKSVSLPSVIRYFYSNKSEETARHEA